MSEERRSKKPLGIARAEKTPRFQKQSNRTYPIRPSYHARKPAMTAEALRHTDAPPRPAAPAVARPVRSATEPESCEPELALWSAALVLLLEDATDFVRRGDDKAGVRSAAHRDLTLAGPMLRHLCGMARVDPHLAREWWQRKMRQAA
jgi:hypothetical protein